MKKNNLVILTTAFSQDKAFSDDYFASLESQSFKKFDVLIVNDGCRDLDLYRADHPSLNIIEISGSNNVAKNRELLINSAIDLGYIKAVFADFDDYFSADRVELTDHLLELADIVVNELKLVTKEGLELGDQFASFMQDGKILCLLDVLEGNCFGMSNTGIRLAGMEKVQFDCQLKVVDWYLFSFLLTRQKTAIFTNRCCTFYRQHESSMANIRAVTKKQLFRELMVKKLHYSLMIRSSSLYEPLLEAVSDFLNNEAFLEKYLILNQKRMSPFWWSLFNAKEYWKNKV